MGKKTKTIQKAMILRSMIHAKKNSIIIIMLLQYFLRTKKRPPPQTKKKLGSSIVVRDAARVFLDSGRLEEAGEDLHVAEAVARKRQMFFLRCFITSTAALLSVVCFGG